MVGIEQVEEGCHPRARKLLQHFGSELIINTLVQLDAGVGVE